MKKSFMKTIWYILVVWGTINSVAFIAHYDGFRDLGFVSVSSPLPLVFSAYNGYETFATGFNIMVKYKNGTVIDINLDVNTYGKITGPYNRKNIYGAIFSHGPFFNNENLVKIRQQILHYAVCDDGSGYGSIAKNFGLIENIYKNNNSNIYEMHVDIVYRSKNNTKVGYLNIICV